MIHDDAGISTKDLTWFFMLAQLEHATEAAARLGISQPTLSRSLARLERHLGTELFDREGRRLKLNRYGRIFCDHAHRALLELANAETLIGELVDPAHGEIHLGYQSWLGPWLIPELIGRFLRLAPGVRFSLRAASGATLEELLGSGVFDLIFTTRRPAPPVNWKFLLSEDLFLAVSPNHQFAKRSSIALAEAQNEDFLMPLAGLRHVIDDLCARAGFTARVISESYEYSTIQGLVAAGVGVAVLHDDHAKMRSDVAYIPLSDAGSRRDVGIAWMQDRPESPVAVRFRRGILGQVDPNASYVSGPTRT